MKTEAAHKKFLSRKFKDGVFLAALLAVPVAHFVIFWGVVNFNSILMAFQRFNPNKSEYYFTLDNFKNLWLYFTAGTLRTAIFNTLLTWGFLTFFLMPWSFFLTYFLFKKIRLTGFWRTMLFVPTILPIATMAMIFRYMVYPVGPIGSLWELFGAKAPAFLTDPKYGPWTVLLYIFWTNFGGQFILLSSAMSRVPNEVIESARLDGAGMRVEMLKILLPLCWPTISMLLLLNLATIFTVSGPILFLTGDASVGNTETISYFIFFRILKNIDIEEPSALGLFFTLVLFPLILLSRWALSKVYADVEF